MNFSLQPKKSLGQNFLIDKNIINKIISIAAIKENQTILEIGAGSGNLTEILAINRTNKVYAIEKDKKLSLYLKKKFQKFENVNVINDDIFNIIERNNLGQNVIVIGNLPYNISTQVLASLIMLKKWPPWYKILILMFQKEVADRIIAKAHSKNFGRLSILADWRLDIKKNFDVSKNCFFPKPKINSTVLSFKPKKKVFNIKNPKNLETVTRILFSSRRKMINKNFLKLFNGDVSVAKKLNINLKERPDKIDKEIYYKITEIYEKLNN